ncbi:(-)-isopiperitenol/(-)-carveol dehydrogenase, mitochondrial [Morus notabilis]|uniref:(-)-isopiperitenol/(-)-carveol dehydrogenase, mitochondrial n=1 Tax=Morus notabilis TaxID=981085 RepID=UPI000CED14D3|nr:(-)-isopiperitenol/(-)-carveol dehydrogenase, mitochondrial [Morus notabilis]
MADTIASRNKLHGKVAIVTGGASGIGEASARSFAAHGARAVVIADVQDEKGQNVAVSIGPERCSYVHCDITDEEQVKTLVESTVRKCGRLDVMFSNAGVPSASDQTVLDLDFSAFERLLAVNVRGMAACVKHAARAMVEGGVKGGSVVCTANAAARVGMERFTDYVMSKHALLGLVRSASLQLAKHGIRVNSVSPGGVGTPLLRAMLGIEEEVELDEVVEGFSRMKGTMKAKNVADAVVFLASEDSEFMTGHDLAVDGGNIM